MKTAEFNQNFEVDRKARAGVRANPKHAHTEPSEILTADSAAYDANQIYFFFDEQTQEIRQSLGLRRDGNFLSTFGLRVVPVANLRLSQNDALADGQAFFKSEIERLQKRIQNFELDKSGAAHN